MHESIGWNFRITDLQAALGIAQLERLDRIEYRKRANLASYRALLEDLDGLSFLQFEPGTDPIVPFRAVIFASDAPALMQHLIDYGVQPRTLFQPMHRQWAFQESSGQDADYPISVFGAEHGICLPVYPTLRADQLQYVCSTIRSYYRKD
jgi:perosamine synthetase